MYHLQEVLPVLWNSENLLFNYYGQVQKKRTAAFGKLFKDRRLLEKGHVLGILKFMEFSGTYIPTTTTIRTNFSQVKLYVTG